MGGLRGSAQKSMQSMVRRSLVTAAAALGALVLVSGAAADQSYVDTSGDATGGAPDIGAIRVTHDAGGTITFSISVAGLPAADTYVDIWIDADRSGNTGDAGLDFDLYLDGSDLSAYGSRWNGTAWVDWVPPTGRTSFQSGVWTTSINRVDLNNTTAFDFFLIGSKYSGETEIGRDDAPNGDAVYTYVLTQAPPAPPPAQPEPRTYEDAPNLPSRIKYVGKSIKHVRLGEKLYSTMKRLGAPRVVAVACWSKADWPSVLKSVGSGPQDRIDGFWLGIQPRWLHLSPKQCTDVQGLMSDRQPNGQRAYALSSVLHERVHAQGVAVEAQAECYSVQLVYDFAIELNFVRTKALRLEQLAVRKSNAVFTGTRYRDPVRCRDGGAWDLFPQFQNLTY